MVGLDNGEAMVLGQWWVETIMLARQANLLVRASDSLQPNRWSGGLYPREFGVPLIIIEVGFGVLESRIFQ